MTQHEELQAKIEIEEQRIPLTDSQEQEHRKKVLTFLSRVPCSFMSEISWETGVTEYHLKPALYRLDRDGEIEQLIVDFWKPDPRLIRRVPDQSARGQGGFENFNKKRWFAITKKGLELLLVDEVKA